MLNTIGIVILIISLYKIRFSRPLLSDFLEKNECTAIRGLLALSIIVTHIPVNSEGQWMYRLFGIGYLAVAVFFFLSGYGLMINYLSRLDYLKNFLSKRAVSIVLPFVAAFLLYWLASVLLGEPYSTQEVLASLYNGEPIAKNSWYMIASIFFYLTFYSSAKLLQDKAKITIATGTACFLWALICIKLGYLQHWYISHFAFCVGVFVAAYREKLLPFFLKHYLIIALPILLSMPLLRNLPGAYGFSVLKAFHSTVFAFVVALLTLCIHLKSPVLLFLGKISLELYLYHGLFIQLFRSNILYIENDFSYVIVVILGTITLSIPMNYFLNHIKASFTKNKTSAIGV